MKKILALVFSSLILLLFSSCSNPTTATKEILSKEIARTSNGFLTLDNFTKTDAIAGTGEGVSYYKISYVATVKCVKDGGWIQVDNGSISELNVWPMQCKESPPMFGGGGQPLRYCHNTETKIGDTYQYKDHMMLIKHENGWQIKQD